MGKQSSSRNESYCKFGVDGGKEDRNVCPLRGKRCCVSLAAGQSACANPAAVANTAACLTPALARDEGGVGGNREHCNSTLLRSTYRAELELPWSEWAWERAALARKPGFLHCAAQQMTCLIQWLDFQRTGNEPYVLWP